MNKKPQTSGVWISIDGSEGVGKTLFVDYLCKNHKNFIVVPEFSDNSVGKFLKDSVTHNPHYITSSKLGQSLLFLSDFFTLYDTVILPNIQDGNIVISDRGFLSKYVYQYIVLSDQYEKDRVFEILNSLFKFIRPPDLTLYIRSQIDKQEERLMSRDGHCNEQRLNFIKKANSLFTIASEQFYFQTSIVNNGDDIDKDCFIRQCVLVIEEYLHKLCLQKRGG